MLFFFRPKRHHGCLMPPLLPPTCGSRDMVSASFDHAEVQLDTKNCLGEVSVAKNLYQFLGITLRHTPNFAVCASLNLNTLSLSRALWKQKVESLISVALEKRGSRDPIRGDDMKINPLMDGCILPKSSPGWYGDGKPWIDPGLRVKKTHRESPNATIPSNLR